MIWVAVAAACYFGISVLWKHKTEKGFIGGFVRGFRNAAGRDPSEEEIARAMAMVWVAAFMWPLSLPSTVLNAFRK